ncbi:unnamed protein product [Rotaria sp. Silwood2]|nr:unnamed protein product [Rotaria sp. Silwood2]CAF2638350.1 unnamed protein product [Rotaria sp. Silwood2]CAF3033713.1 unnamed protein product [Rotaria sp. Silwood2]CAF4220337.1 unnamed protein product [Rotaria sp. Silwood2]CAF4328493.1 unnamed protein product [Rotaria sp. Silwood2]
MSQSCSIEKCIRKSRGLCDCCQQNLCLQHLNEHNASLISQLNPLTDETNALGDRLKTLNIQKTIGNSRQKLEQWRQDCYKKIDCLFEQKCQELDQLINDKIDQQRREFNCINSKISELINSQETTRQDIDSLTATIHQLKRNMNDIEQTCFIINTRPLRIDDTFILIKNTTEKELDISTLSSVYKTIHRPEGSCVSLTCSDRYLLIYQRPNLCLIDRELNIAKQTLWSYGIIQDMCWSSTLDRFIVLGKSDIFLINEHTMSIDNVHTIEERDWGSCTYSDTVLFASTNEGASSIMEFTLFPAIELIREWKYPLTCRKDENIDGMAYNNGNLALIVMNDSKKSLRIELRYGKTLDLIWRLQLDIMCSHDILFRCCSLTCNEWLIIDYETGYLLQITNDGKIKKTIQYSPSPYRATLFDLNKLAISTGKYINLHTI